MDEKELLKLSVGELVDLGVCPTCLNRKHNGALYGDNKDKLLYEDDEIECFFVGNPRADGHMCISTIEHFHDMSEAPDYINEKIIRFAKLFMLIIKEVYKCERVYICSMCDGPNNHYHVQLIPRYAYEQRGSRNFVKERKSYVYDEKKFGKVKCLLREMLNKNRIYKKDGLTVNSNFAEAPVIGNIVKVTIDRPLGSRHPKHRDIIYPVNYGYIEGIMAQDGEEQDAYVLGVGCAVKEFTGRVIAVIHRNDDVEDKWVVAPDGINFTDEEIAKQVRFQEQYFDYVIKR